jgi:gamma-glutamyltranspeptidase / glutathione hydrolase
MPTAAVATPHPQATFAAGEILRAGGNAFDAAVAAVLTLGVVQPQQVGLGGYGGALVAHLGDEGRNVAIDFDSRAPLDYTPAAFAKPADRASGYRSVTVPAVLAGLELALKSYGTMGWPQVAAHAIRCGEDGFVVEPNTAVLLEDWHHKTDAESLGAFFPDGKIPKAGERWVQKPLAQVLRRIADHGAEAFYRGDIADQIVRHLAAHGSILTGRDFSEYRARGEDALSAKYRGHDVCTPPPPAGGLTMLQILKTVEHFDLAATQPWSAEYFHVLAQAAKLCWRDRVALLGDPDFVKVSIQQLLSDAGALERARLIQTGVGRASTRAATQDPPCTANVSIVDAHRNAVSLTATQGVYFGSQVVIPGLGLVMNHGMSRFDFAPEGNPNVPLPGKRMQHNMAPAIVLKNGVPRYVMGLPGGTKIITVTAQLIVSLIDFRATPRQAAFAPRVHAQGDSSLAVSSAVTDAVMGQLRAMGHEVVRGQVERPQNEIAGNANIIAIDPAAGAGGKVDAVSQASEDAAAVI